MLSAKCPLCEHAEARQVASLASGVKVLRCVRCGLKRTDPIPSVDSGSSGARSVLTSEDYTAGMVSSYESRRPFFRRLALQRHERYVESLGKSTYRLLEIGCGIAGMAEGFQSVGVDYSGLDLDARPITFALSRGVGSVRVGDFMDEAPSEPFDVVTCSQVIEHIKTPVEFIRRIGCSLRLGGVLHLDAPNHDALAGQIAILDPRSRNRYGGIEYPHHALAYSAGTLEYLLKSGWRSSVFTATPSEPCWGQPGPHRVAARAYFALSAAVSRKSLLVAYATSVETAPA